MRFRVRFAIASVPRSGKILGWIEGALPPRVDGVRRAHPAQGTRAAPPGRLSAATCGMPDGELRNFSPFSVFRLAPEVDSAVQLLSVIGSEKTR